MAIETPKYKILKKDKKIQIRDYESAVVAKTYVTDNFKEASSTGFRRIANFIFGGNSKGKNISMTAPVVVSKDYNTNKHEVFFFMPREYKIETLPKPSLESVVLENKSLGKVASISFGGWATEKSILYNKEILKKYLKKNSYEILDNFMVAQYNSPWALPPFRKNEIIVKIN
tara:strand:+ start:2618 stop:3133 length:516 start_codon:yes stop_codon:yes gene_type:complete